MQLLIIALTLGPLLAAVAALGVWLALGGATLMWRSMTALLAASLLGIAFCVISGEADIEWLGLVWIVVVTIAGMFVLVRQRGFRLVDENGPIAMGSDEFRFSVSQLMGLTAVVAVVVTLARFLAPRVATVNALMAGVAIALCLGLLAVVVVFTTLRDGPPKLGAKGFWTASILMAGLVYIGMEVTDADPGSIWAAVFLVYAMALRRLCRYARSLGFSLVSLRRVSSLTATSEP